MYKFTASKAKFGLNRIIKLLVLPVLALILSACTIGPPPTIAPTRTPIPRPASPVPTQPLPTITPAPPPAAPTLRPALPPTPAGVQLQKKDTLQAGLGALINNYYSGLNSGDVYEVALRGIQDALVNAKVSNPQVPFPNFTGNAANDWLLFLNAYTIVVDRYRSQLSEDDMAYAALQNAAGSLNECETRFYPPSLASDFIANRLGQSTLVGIGVNVQTYQNGDGLYITRVVPGGPADKAGLKLGEVILSVDGQSLKGKNVTDATRILFGGRDRAVPDSKLTAEVKGVGNAPVRTVDMVRTQVKTQWIESSLIDNTVGYLRINSFPYNPDQQQLRTLVGQLDTVLRDFTTRNVKGIVLDLRGTRWGVIATMQTVISRFTSGNDLALLRTMQNNKSTVLQFPTIANVQPVQKPLAVLIDGSTRDEAEIFALSLQQKQAARLFGTASFGCVVASFPLALPDNSIMNVVSYRAIEDGQDPASIVTDVTPDEQIELAQADLVQGRDTQLNKAVDYIKNIP